MISYGVSRDGTDVGALCWSIEGMHDFKTSVTGGVTMFFDWYLV